MDRLLEYARANQARTIALIRELVECESPSDDPAAVDRFMDLFASKVERLGRVETFPGGANSGRHLRCVVDLPGPTDKRGQILALGHGDTVWPVGTLKSMPWREEGGRLWGPGVFDMKAGLAFLIAAVEGLRELDIPVERRLVLQVNGDEEVGSESSRRLTEEAAKQSDAVLVLEPSAGLDGKCKTARKGVGDYEIVVRGISAHSGLDFEAGASAIVELARQIERIAGFTQLDRGLTVNPGVIQGGTRANVVAAEARVAVDMRIARMSDAAPLDVQFRELKPFNPRCTIEVTGGLNRPPLERTPAVARLFEQAREMAGELGVTLGETAVGGGSDGNFTGALGVPTLDGIGAVGEGAHAANESILIDRIADRTALIGKLIAGLRAS